MGMLMRRRIKELQENANDKKEIESFSEEKEMEMFNEQNEIPEEEEEKEDDKVFSYEELSSMTVKQIKEIAEEKGYTISKIIKEDVISEFLSQQK